MYPTNVTFARLIEDWTESILKHYMGLTGKPLQLPVPIFDIAEQMFGLRCDIETLRGRLCDVSGVLISDKRWVILNKRQAPARLRYTLAHELAHWLIDHEEYEPGSHRLEHLSGLRCEDEYLRERRANLVASALLMPRHMVLDEASRCRSIGDAEVSALATTFDVSHEAMRMRLWQLESDLRFSVFSQLSLEQGAQGNLFDHQRAENTDQSPSKAVMVKVSYPILDHALYRKLQTCKRDYNRLYIALDDQDYLGVEALLDLDCVDGFVRLDDSCFEDLEQESQAEPAHAVVFRSIVSGSWYHALRPHDHDQHGGRVNARAVTLRTNAPAQVKMHSLLDVATYIEPPQKLSYRNEARLFVRKAQEDGRRVVVVTGCFDMLTTSHVQFLKRARGVGDVLVVGIEDDARVRAFKGPLRPVNTISQRIEVMDALECVDFTFVIKGSPKVPLKEFYSRLHKTIRADILAVTEGDPHMQDRRNEIEAAGGELVTVSHFDGNSTTSLIRQFLAELEYSDMLLVSKRQLDAYASEREGKWRQLVLPSDGLDPSS